MILQFISQFLLNKWQRCWTVENCTGPFLTNLWLLENIKSVKIGSGNLFPQLFHDGGRYHIETSPGFYMITAPVMKELNWKSLTYRKRVIHRTKIERPFLAGKGFNTNLVHFLLPYYVIILLVTCMYAFFTCTISISHVYGRAAKTVLRPGNLSCETYCI